MFHLQRWPELSDIFIDVDVTCDRFVVSSGN